MNRKFKIEATPSNEREEKLKLSVSVDGKDYVFFSDVVPEGTARAIETIAELAAEEAQNDMVYILRKASEMGANIS